MLANSSAPYPQIVLPSTGFWADGVATRHESSLVATVGDNDDHDHQTTNDEAQTSEAAAASNSCARFKLETDDTAHCYRRHFLGWKLLIVMLTDNPRLQALNITTSLPKILHSAPLFSASAPSKFRRRTTSASSCALVKAPFMRSVIIGRDNGVLAVWLQA